VGGEAPLPGAGELRLADLVGGPGQRVGPHGDKQGAHRVPRDGAAMLPLV
jgi:hypothetical protein